MRAIPHSPPRINPCCSIACFIYSEQLGSYRQCGGNRGEIYRWYTDKQNVALYLNTWRILMLHTPLS